MIINPRPALQKMEGDLEGLIRDAAIFGPPADAGAIAKAGKILREAFQLGHDEATAKARHENHDAAWDGDCSLCDAEREAEGQVLTSHGWDWPE